MKTVNGFNVEIYGYSPNGRIHGIIKPDSHCRILAEWGPTGLHLWSPCSRDNNNFNLILKEQAITGHDGKPWPQTVDAKIWADEFCKQNTAADHGTMLAWFANAIMIGYDAARWDQE